MARLSHSKSKERQSRQQQKAAADTRVQLEEKERVLVKTVTVFQKWVLRKWVLPKRAKARALAKALVAYKKRVIADRVPVKAPAEEHYYSLEELTELYTVVDSFFAYQ